jgi:Fe-S cluster assembly ATP-binding protein
MDETDSGLDIDALKVVSAGANSLRRPDNAILMVTHYQRLLDYIVPDYVHVMLDGRIVRSGDKGLALALEEKGYDWVEREMQPACAADAVAPRTTDPFERPAPTGRYPE